LYPGTGALEIIGADGAEGLTVNLPLPPGTGSASYLHAFEEIIPPLTKQFKPEVIVFQSGVDTHHEDPLADLNLTFQVYYELAKRVQQLSSETCKKLAVLLGGGYNSDACIQSYYNIFCGLVGREDFLVESDIPDPDPQQIDFLINALKNRLKEYWKF
jgi:acetoin utilization protein AcuC